MRISRKQAKLRRGESVTFSWVTNAENYRETQAVCVLNHDNAIWGRWLLQSLLFSWVVSCLNMAIKRFMFFA